MASLDDLFKSDDFDMFGERSVPGLEFSRRPSIALSEMEQVQRGNDLNRALLASVGEKDPTVKQPSVLDRLFGVLDTPGTGVRAGVHNLLNAVSDEDVSILGEMSKSLKGEKRIEGADILKDQGVTNKWGLMLGGFVLDVLLDPTTYLTSGVSSFTKAESLAKLGKIADTGLDAAKVADLALDTSKLSAPVREAIEGGGKVLAAQLTKDDSRLIASAVRSAVGAARGDYGGVKFLGQTIVPAQDAIEKAGYAAKDLVRKTKPAEWFEKAFINGDLTSLTREGNEVFNAGLKMAQRKRNAAFALAREGGSEVQRALEKAIPDEKVRNLVTFGIGRQFGDLADQGALKPLYEAVSAADSPEALATAQEALQGQLGRLWNADAVTDTLRSAGITDESLLTQVGGAVQNLQGHFDELSKLRGEKGLPNWSLYGKAEGRPESAGYIPGMPVAKQSKAQTAALDELGIATGPLRDQERGLTLASITSKNNPAAYKSKEFINAEARLVDGGLLTETDIAALAGAKTAKDYADVALADFQTAITNMTGGEATPELQEFLTKSIRAFTNDDAMKGFLGTYDKSLNVWRRWATIYNIPRFVMRNAALSNKYLQWAEDGLSLAGEKHSLDIIGKLITKQALGEADDVLLREAMEDGVFTTAAALSEQVGSTIRRSRFKPIAAYEAFAGGLNAIGENQARLSAYITYKNKGLSRDAASLMVDKALYDYSPEALTAFERNFMKRLVPFYTWVRRNTPHMAELLIKNPGKLTVVGHLKETGDTVNPVDESVTPDWLRDIYAVSTPVNSPEGNPIQIATDGVLPIGDLEKVAAVLTSPTQAPREFLQNLSPLIKTPLEIVMNHDLYYDEELASYKGEKRRAPAYVEVFDDVVSAVPGLSDLWGGIKGAFGMEEVVDDRTGSPYLKMDARAAKAMKDLNPWMNAVGKTLSDSPRQAYDTFSYLTGLKAVMYDTEGFREQQVYDDRGELQDAVRGARDMGLVQPKTRTKQIDLDAIFGR